MGHELAYWTRNAASDAELDQFPEAVLDVQPHSAERGHEALDFEGLVGAGAQEPQQPRSQGGLNEAPEASVFVALRPWSNRGLAVGGVDWCVHRQFAGVSVAGRESDSTAGGQVG
jgi:hypothetical protein